MSTIDETAVDEIVVAGSCSPAFAAVATEFERNFRERGEIGASVCLIADGETVVDLWGGTADPTTGARWGEDTVGLVWSCTKGATALCAHLLADRGELDFDAPVAQYWPEFAAAGKDMLPVRLLLNHQAGLPALREQLPTGAFNDWELMTERLAAEAPFWEPGSRHGYHAFTFGWLVGEVVRRVSGVSLGEFFTREVARPLGLDFWIGLPEDLEPRVAPTQLFAPSSPTDIPELLALALADPESVTGRVMFNNGGYFAPGACDARAAHAAEIGAAGGIGNARSLAGLYAALLPESGTPLVSPTTLTRMAAVESAARRDAVVGVPTRFSAGFMMSLPVLGPGGGFVISEDAFGHPGLGGSIGFVDPRARLAFGYTMNRHGSGFGLDARGQSLVDAAYAALGWTRFEEEFLCPS